jgi:pilus assembly protein CpaC
MRGVNRTIGAWSGVGVCLAAVLTLSPANLAGQAGAAQAPAAPAPQAPAAPAPAAPAPQAPPPPPPIIAPNAVQNETDGGRIRLLAGRSMVLNTGFDIRRLAITNPVVADGTVVSPRELLIDGKQAGTISLLLWGDTERVHYELVVEPAVTTLEQKLQELFPGEDIKVSVSEGAVILNGRVSNNDVMLRAAEIAGSSLPGQRVINMLQLPGGTVSQQVMLQVRFAEVNRRAIQELGINLFVARSSWVARATTGQFPAPEFEGNDVTFSDLLNVFFFHRNEGIGGVLKALNQSGDLQSLAEPNLIAYNGQEAQFLAGGEIPVPVVSGSSGNVSITYKEFGIRLRFRPTIAGDALRLHVRPEVSTLDFANGVTLAGFRVPALTTRYAETDVELRDGQSFAIAGLLNNIGQSDSANIPILSQIPIIGYLFKSRAQRTEQTELLVLITPRLVRPLNPDEVPPLPTTVGTGAPPPAEGLVDAPRPPAN